MQRKPGYPAANCSIKMPDSLPVESAEEDSELQHRRQQLINFGHAQWGFNNWNWAVTKQELDFVDFTNGKYCAGVVAFVSISVKTIDIHRENIGYATSVANNKGFAIYKSRKVAVTNALRETLLSFGGAVATELTELLETTRDSTTEPLQENNQNIANSNIPNTANTNLANANPINSNIHANHTNNLVKPLLEGPPLVKNLRKTSIDSGPVNPPMNPPPVKNAAPPVAKAHPMPVPPRAPAMPAPAHRPNSNEPAKLEGMTEEEARAERKRRQRQAQEEFRQKQLVKQGPLDDKQERNVSLDRLLLEIPTQDIVIEETGASKRKSPTPELCAKRRASISRLDILHD